MRSSQFIADLVFNTDSKKRYQDLEDFSKAVYQNSYHSNVAVPEDSGISDQPYAFNFNRYFLSVNNVSDLQKLTRRFKKNAQSDWLFVKVENYFQSSGGCGYVFFYKDENGNILQRVLSKSGLDSLYLCESYVDLFVNKEYQGYYNYINHILYRYCSRENPSDLGLFQFMSSEKFKGLIDKLNYSDNDLKKKFFLLILAKFFKDRFETFKDYFKNSSSRLITRGIHEECGVSCKRIESHDEGQGCAKVIIQRHAIKGDDTANVIYLKIKKYDRVGKLQNSRNYRDLSSSDDRLKNVYCFIKVTFKDDGQAEIDGSNVYFCKVNNPHVKTAMSINSIHENYRKELLKDIEFNSPIKIESYLQTAKDLAKQPDLKITQHIKEYQFNPHNLSFTACGDSIDSSISSDNGDVLLGDRSGQLKSRSMDDSLQISDDPESKAGSDLVFVSPKVAGYRASEVRGKAGFEGSLSSSFLGGGLPKRRSSRIGPRESLSASWVQRNSGQSSSGVNDRSLQIPADLSVAGQLDQRYPVLKVSRRAGFGGNSSGIFLREERLSRRQSSRISPRESLSASSVHRNSGQSLFGVNDRSLQIPADLSVAGQSDQSYLRNRSLEGDRNAGFRRNLSGSFLGGGLPRGGSSRISPRESSHASLVRISPKDQIGRGKGGNSSDFSPRDTFIEGGLVHISPNSTIGYKSGGEVIGKQNAHLREAKEVL